MSSQQLLDRIFSDIALLTKAFVDDRRHMAAVTLQKDASQIRNATGVMPIAEQVEEMSDEGYVPVTDGAVMRTKKAPKQVGKQTKLQDFFEKVYLPEYMKDKKPSYR